MGGKASGEPRGCGPREAGSTPASPSARVAFFVPGRPRSTQTGRVIRLPGGQRIPLRRNRAWSAAVRLIAQQHRPPAPLDGPLSADLLFLLKRPARPAHPYPSQIDADNMAKGLLDAMRGVIFHDDRQIVDLLLRKRWTLDTDGVRVEVRSVPDDWSPEYQP